MATIVDGFILNCNVIQFNYLPQFLYKQMCETDLVMIRQPYMDIFILSV